MTRLGDLEPVKQKLELVRRRIKLQDSVGLDDKLAQSIIDALREGTAPGRGAILFAVGREDILRDIRSELEKVSVGGSALKVLVGDYGMGKTLTLRILQDYAFQQGFATSFVTLTPRECPLYDLRLVYQHLAKHIRVEACRDRPALEFVLERWADRVRRDVEKRGKLPWSFWQLSSSYKEALAIYFKATLSSNFVLAERALSWLYGDMNTLSDAKRLGLSAVITSDNALEMLGNLTNMIRDLQDSEAWSFYLMKRKPFLLSMGPHGERRHIII